MLESMSIVSGLVARPRPACPCSFQQLPSYLVQAAGVAEGKTAQERPERRRGRHPGAEKFAGTPRAQHVVRSGRGAVPAFQLGRFPGPPPEPGLRLSPHPALHRSC